MSGGWANWAGKEIVLDLAEATKYQYPAVQEQLFDFGVVGPGPRRALNWRAGKEERGQTTSPLSLGGLVGR